MPLASVITSVASLFISVWSPVKSRGFIGDVKEKQHNVARRKKIDARLLLIIAYRPQQSKETTEDEIIFLYHAVRVIRK
jgi:hypothetical protein